MYVYITYVRHLAPKAKSKVCISVTISASIFHGHNVVQVQLHSVFLN